MLTQLLNMDRAKHFYAACSGGVDSMAVADFYHRGNKNFSLAYFHHGTPQADQMQTFVSDWGKTRNIRVVTGQIVSSKPKQESPEEFFRNERYKWLRSLNEDIVTCHHLNDVMETWLFSCLHGNPKLIAAKADKIHRPFLLNEKSAMIDWCTSHDVKWVEDTSNEDVHYPRNRIRHNILPECLQVNPGLSKVLKKKLMGTV